MTIPRPAQPLTATQRQTLEAYLAHRGIKGAAAALEVPEATVRSRLHNARIRTGLPTVGHLLYWLNRPS
jgi:hypothetical protein